MVNRIYNRLGTSRPERRPFVEYRRPDGRFPGEEQVREILGDSRVDAVLQKADAEAARSERDGNGNPPLRLVK